MLLLTLLGCVPSLSDLTIQGEPTELQEAVVIAEIARFASWVGEERLRVRGLELVEPDEIDNEWGAVFDGRRISVDSTLDGDALTRAVRHGLCLALDAEEALSEADVFQRLAQVAPSPDGAAAAAFAVLCHNGPVAADLLLANACPNDVADASEALGSVATDVYVMSGPTPSGIPRRPSPTASFDPGKGLTTFEVTPTADEQVIRIDTSFPNFDTTWFVDVRNGTPVGEPKNPYEAPPAPAAPPGVSVSRVRPRGMAPDPVVLSARLGDVPVGVAAWDERVFVVRDGSVWQPVTAGCVSPSDPIGFWITGKEVFFAWQQGDRIEWGPAGS